MRPRDDFFRNVRSVALVGASERSFYLSMGIRNLDAHGFDGAVLPVHRAGGVLLGHPVYADVASLPVDPDLGIVGVSADRATQAIEQLAERGCRRVVLIADGYGERADEVGQARTAELLATCRRHRVELVGPNGIGIASFPDRVVAICEPIPPNVTPGRVSVVSHSGAMVSCILDGLVTEGVGVGTVVSVGNGIVTGPLDWLDWMVGDPRTGIIACYAESIADLSRFREIAERAADADKLVVLLAVGRSALGRGLALSHTASVADDHSLLDAVCADTGVALVRDVESIATVCQLHDRRLAADGNGGGPLVITSSGGAATVTADLAADAALTLPDLSAASRAALDDVVSASGYVGNPMDLTASSGLDGPARLRLYRTLLGDDRVAGGLYVLGVNFPGEEDFRAGHRVMMEALAAAAQAADKDVVIANVADQAVTGWMAGLVDESPRLGMVGSLRRTVETLGLLQRRMRYARRDPRPPDPAPGDAADGRWVAEPRAKEILASCGLPVVGGVWLRGMADLDATALPGPGPFAVKGVVRDVAHKARFGLVRLGVRDEPELRAACAAIDASVAEHDMAARFEGYLVEQMLAGFEVMLSTRRTKGVWFLTLALGGSLVEAFGAGASVPLPLHAASWDSLLDRSGLRRVLGALPGDGRRAVRDVAETLAVQAVRGDLARHHTVELNPVIVAPTGVAHVVDALLL